MIDEKKLIEWAELVRKNCIKCFGDYDSARIVQYIIDGIKEQPKVGEWIPCSERLPEEYGNYLVTSDEDVDIGTFNPKTAKWSGCDADGFYWLYDIIAWMPLPEPYKESED